MGNEMRGATAMAERGNKKRFKSAIKNSQMLRGESEKN